MRTNGGKAYLNLSAGGSQHQTFHSPCPCANAKAPPREEKDTAIHVKRVQEWDRPGLVVDWIDLGGLP